MIKSSTRSILYKYARSCLRVFNQQLQQETAESFLSVINVLKKNKSLSPETPLFIVSLFKLLVSAKRSYMFFSVLDIIFLLWCKEQNIKIMYVYSAGTLDPDTQMKLGLYFSENEEKSKIHMVYAIDKKLIAGIRVESKNTVWDYSLKKQLENVKKIVVEKGIS